MININQDAVKELLLKLESCDTDFKVIFSGKKSCKVNGLYKQGLSEIIIHNKNFKNDNELIYTAIHEYAHHLMWCKYHKIGKVPKHNNEFWSIMYNLVDLAEEKGLYKKYPDESVKKEIQNLVSSAKKINEEIASLYKKLGETIREIRKETDKHEIRIEEFDSLKPISKQAKKLFEKIIAHQKLYPVCIKMHEKENTITIRDTSNIQPSFPEFVLLVKEFSDGKEYYPIQEIYFDNKGLIKKIEFRATGYSFIIGSKKQKQSCTHFRLMIENINRLKKSASSEAN